MEEFYKEIRGLLGKITFCLERTQTENEIYMVTLLKGAYHTEPIRNLVNHPGFVTASFHINGATFYFLKGVKG